MEEAGKVNTVVLDKTGTITKGEPKVTDLVMVEGVSEAELLETAYALEVKSEHPLAGAVVAMAEEKKLLLTEAIWTRYIPIQKTLNEVIESGASGKVHSMTANLCYLISGVERLKKPELAGGALLDVGVYPLNFACMIDRTPVVKVTSDAVMNEYGVDSSNSITLTFADGATAMLHSSTLVFSDRKRMIYGDQGYIEVENINNCQGFKVYDTHYQMVKEYPVPSQISGYEYEVEACKKAIEEGRSECPEMPHRESIRMMELMDTIRKEWGLRYPME